MGRSCSSVNPRPLVACMLVGDPRLAPVAGAIYAIFGALTALASLAAAWKLMFLVLTRILWVCDKLSLELLPLSEGAANRFF